MTTEEDSANAQAMPDEQAALTDVSPVSATPTLAQVIDAKLSAASAFNAALDRDWQLERAYFAAYPEREVIIPLQIGDGVSFDLRFDLEQHRQETLDHINAVYKRRDRAIQVLAGVLGEAGARTKIDEYKASDIRKLGEVAAAAQASRDAFGLGQASRDRDAASDADAEAMTAVCAFRCSSFEELGVKAAFILHEIEKSELQSEDLEALLRSMMPEQQEGGAK